jgi:dTDP-4-dehydrorhamnose reductase
MIHISTDYVFDGNGTEPISEEHKTNPVSVYGASKLEGEQKVLEIAGAQALVVRTSSLHGQRGVNFVHTMIDLFSKRDLVKVVSDQYMSPTWAGWLAEVLLDLGRIKCDGVVHASCAGIISWYDFAKEILDQVRPTLENGANVRVETISASEFGRPAKRPSYSGFDCTKLSRILGRKPIPWQEGLKAHLRDIGRLQEEHS